MVRLSVACMLLLSSCGEYLPGRPGSEAAPGQPQAGLVKCTPSDVSLPLLGMPGDSPILPVQVGGRKAAMFFSPGFVPLLFRNNGTVRFEGYRRVALRQQDGDALPASATVAQDLSVGSLELGAQRGYLLPDPDDRVVDGRPITGMLGRDVLPEGAVLDLDLPGRRVAISYLRTGCLNPYHPPAAGSIGMQQAVLLVPVRIDGQLIQAVLEPDLPVSILPRAIAGRLSITDADLANDPSVVTKFGRGVLGRRHRMATLDVGDVRLRQVAFDVEDDVRYAMLGLNFFDLGHARFDFSNNTFTFSQTTRTLPARTSLHFDQTKVAHVMVDQ